MFSAPHFLRTFATLIVLSGGVATTTIGWSQTTTNEPQTTDDEQQTTDDESQSDTNDTSDAADAETSNDTTEQSDSNDDAELTELDTLLLGPWVILSDDATQTPSKAVLDAAIARCFVIPKFERLNIDPAAERALPDAKSLLGDLVYYRTSTGLQRIDLKLGQVVLFPEIKKITEANNTFWAIRGETTGLALRFANTKERGGQGQFMLENQRVYLKCGPGPSSTDEKPAE